MHCHSLHIAGAAHRSRLHPCQDRSRCFSACFGNTIATILLTSDGHGHPSHFRSESGAAFAIDAAIDALNRHLPALTNPSAFFSDIIATWQTKIVDDIRRNPLPDDNDNLLPYGCTLAGAILTSDSAIYFQLGDGAIVALCEDSIADSILPDDPRCDGTYTTSMCNASADDFRILKTDSVPPCVMLTTDGLENCYASNKDLAGDFLLSLAESFVDDSWDETICELPALLERMSVDGSLDDMGLAIAADIERLSAILPYLKGIRITQIKQEIEKGGNKDDIIYLKERISQLQS